MELYHSLRLSHSNLSGDRFDVDKMFENSSVMVLLFFKWYTP